MVGFIYYRFCAGSIWWPSTMPWSALASYPEQQTVGMSMSLFCWDGTLRAALCEERYKSRKYAYVDFDGCLFAVCLFKIVQAQSFVLMSLLFISKSITHFCQLSPNFLKNVRFLYMCVLFNLKSDSYFLSKHNWDSNEARNHIQSRSRSHWRWFDTIGKLIYLCCWMKKKEYI